MKARARAPLGAALFVALIWNGNASAQEPPEGLPTAMGAPWTGDLDGMIARRRIRVLTPYSRTHYFIDKAVERGIVHDAMMKFEEIVNAKHKTGTLKVHVVFIPTSRDELLPALLDGRGDIVAAGLTITPEREKAVDFTDPSVLDVKEIAVTGPQSPAIATVDHLAGKEVFVRPSSSYHESLVALNQRLREMVNAKLVKIVVVDDYIASF